MGASIAQLGEFGEQEVRSLLERALAGSAMQLSGFADKGIDLILQFISPGPDEQPLHFGVQVKTGDSFAEAQRNRWRIKNLTKHRFEQWKKSRLPILFIWVRPTNPAECYWRFVLRNSDRKHFMISKQSIITPAVRYEYALQYFSASPNNQEEPIRLLRPPLAQGIRPFAKDYYRNVLKNTHLSHPMLGSVKVTWRGWKHLTSSKRPLPYIHQSLQLLSAVPWAIENPSELVGIRRLGRFPRGAWTTELRLLIFKTKAVKIIGRVDADIVIALRERIWYPTRWQNNVNLHRHVYREVFFESVYENLRQK